jgi:hypothetical protein
MALNFSGSTITAEELATQVFTPGSNGSLQTDLISGARRQGYFAIPIKGLPSLLKEIAAGHPVIVFENIGLNWMPMWHYSLVIGYDLSAQEITMHTGIDQAKSIDMRVFERSWMLGNYWGLVVLATDKLSTTSSELDHSIAAAGIESAGVFDKAKQAYETILAKWPYSLSASIGGANIAYKNKNYTKAVHLLKLALSYHPQSTIARHNLSVAEKALIK